MAIYKYNSEKIGEIIRNTSFNRASLKHATGISNETTAIRWENGEDIYVSRLCQIANYMNVPIMEFFVKDEQPLCEDAPAAKIAGSRGKPRSDNGATASHMITATIPTAEGEYSEADILKLQLEHQRQLMAEREAFHELELSTIKNEENIKAKVRAEYDTIIAEKNRIIEEKNQMIADKDAIIANLRAELLSRSTIIDDTTPYGLAENQKNYATK